MAPKRKSKQTGSGGKAGKPRKSKSERTPEERQHDNMMARMRYHLKAEDEDGLFQKEYLKQRRAKKQRWSKTFAQQGIMPYCLHV
eukprot:7267716-Pyramimonas_sp.AAC.1